MEDRLKNSGLYISPDDVRHNVRHKTKKHLSVSPKCFIFSVPARARTVDPLIKSQLLYQLSYRDILGPQMYVFSGKKSWVKRKYYSRECRKTNELV